MFALLVYVCILTISLQFDSVKLGFGFSPIGAHWIDKCAHADTMSAFIQC